MPGTSFGRSSRRLHAFVEKRGSIYAVVVHLPFFTNQESSSNANRSNREHRIRGAANKQPCSGLLCWVLPCSETLFGAQADVPHACSIDGIIREILPCLEPCAVGCTAWVILPWLPFFMYPLAPLQSAS
jgi:hypothetical protein